MKIRSPVEDRADAAAVDRREATTGADRARAGVTQPVQPPATASTASGKAAPRTRVSSAWTAVAVGLVLLTALLIFMFQNLQEARVTFLGFHARLPLALSLLSSAILGALVVLLLGVSRMVQLRLAARRHRQAAVVANRVDNAR
jgi:uncharacterized integral membrane protein